MALYAFDGTWNREHDQAQYSKNSNVVKFAKAYLAQDIDAGPFAFHDINLGWKLKLPPIVDHCFHAVAIDERRESFRATRLQGAYEVWFRGVHSDVGGGNDNVALNNIPLAWMLRKAAAVGVPVDRSVAEGLVSDPDAPIRPSSKDPLRDPFRTIKPKEWVHHTIRVRKHDDCQNPPEGCLVETPELEIHRISLV